MFFFFFFFKLCKYKPKQETTISLKIIRLSFYIHVHLCMKNEALVIDREFCQSFIMEHIGSVVEQRTVEAVFMGSKIFHHHIVSLYWIYNKKSVAYYNDIDASGTASIIYMGPRLKRWMGCLFLPGKASMLLTDHLITG